MKTGNVTISVDGSNLRGNFSNYNSTGTYRNDDDSLTYYKLNGMKYYLVNASGSVVKTKNGIKDGDNWFFFVKNYDVKLYTNQKELTPAKVNGVPVDTTANLDN